MESSCKRQVQRNKYERNAPEISKWWYELFDILEFDASIVSCLEMAIRLIEPPDKKLLVLQDVFPKRILERILSILSVDKEKFNIELPSPEPPVVLPQIPKERFGSKASLDTARSTFDYEELSLNAKSLKSLTTSSMMVVKEVDKPPPEAKAIPYVNFFKRRPDRAAIWRALPPLLLEEMNLIQKAEAITEAIATDFVSWIKSLSEDDESTISVKSVMEMFEIAMQLNSATSLCVKLKEMPSVPQKVAEAMQLPERSRRAMLYREIKRDHRAERQECRIAAFGSRLPTEMQIRPLKENVNKKWLSCEKVPERLKTMAAVWQGITHLNSTRAFCRYLYIHKPNITPPKYLEDMGMMKPATLISTVDEKSEPSRESSFGNVSNITSFLSRVND